MGLINFLKKITKRRKLRKFYDSMSYIDAYREHQNLRVENNPLGGYWEELGELQFSFLKPQGLEPEHRLLDLGCGTLRAGRHFIGYLEPRKYTGIELSRKSIDYGHSLVEEEGLSPKQPNLILNSDGNLRFECVDGRFDFMLAQSVFTHLPEPFILECFDNVGKVLGGTFYFTIIAVERAKISQKSFRYPVDWFRDVVESRGYVFADRSADYAHPGDQVMLMASRS